MLKISSTQFLFIMELIVVSVGAALFFFIQYRRVKSSLRHQDALSPGMPQASTHASSEKPSRHGQSKGDGEITEWKRKCNDLQQKFDQMKEINNKLRDLISSVIPESSMSVELGRLLEDMASNKNELDACISGLKQQMNDMGQQITSYKKQGQTHKKEVESQKEELNQLRRKLKDTVKKADYDSIEADKNRLMIRVEQLEKQLKERNEEFKKIEKEHMWLEKEYNRIYNNIDDEYEASLKEAAAKKSLQQPDGEPVQG